MAAITGLDGKPIERYEYTPFGETTVKVDSTPPVVQQLRVKGGAIWLELSEEMLEEALGAAAADHSLGLEDVTHAQAVPYTLTFPILGRQIGWQGGSQAGNVPNPLYTMRIVVQPGTNRLVTAYPTH